LAEKSHSQPVSKFDSGNFLFIRTLRGTIYFAFARMTGNGIRIQSSKVMPKDANSIIDPALEYPDGSVRAGHVEAPSA